ncbi:hypothetical protein V7S43_010876 [Phytophthora oleae]|uniref:EGF-like domain-containing protein n=1 Tax=Phytophthora oleae TaxID=2107226 RepID=A0ABD3FCH0_9STRA
MRVCQVLILQLFAVFADGLLHREAPGPEAELPVSTSYDALWDVPVGLHQVRSADTNVFASVLVAPVLGNDGSESPRTHVAYNCTTTSSLWDLQQDPNVLEIESFQSLNGDAVAVATVADCEALLHSSVDRIVVGNAFFGAEFATSPSYFRVIDRAVLEDAANSVASRCRVRLEMEQATFAHVYPDCRIKFHSTDFTNLLQIESTYHRKLDATSFGFVKDSTCDFDCGEESDAGEIDVDKCWAKDGFNWTKEQCTLQFYEQNSDCTTECGYEGDEKLSASQCYDCSSSDGSCASGYNSTEDGCCRILECEPVNDAAVTKPGKLSWNLEDDGLTVSNASYSLFQAGNCSNMSDPASNCCRITCENCFLNVSVASMFANVEIVGISYEEAIEMGLTGNASLQVVLYAPNGCTLDETTQLKNTSFTFPLGETGISIDITMGLDLHRRLSLQPHGSIATIGATADLSLTSGSLKSDTFYDVQISSNTSSKLAQSSIDLEMELELLPSFQVSLSMLKNLAKVGIKVDFLVFLELNSTFQFPEPFPGLSSEFLDDSSLWHGGNCQLPHYMEYNCNAGYGEVNISIPMSLKIPRIRNTSPELDIVSSSNRSSYSLFSGCVATSYDVEMLLSTAINAVSSLSAESQLALQTILVWTLGLTDIDPDFVNITSVSNTTGEISITLSVPPSLGEIYVNSSEFLTEIYLRARNETFARTVSDYVGLEISAQCDGGWWGAQCEKVCSAENCTSGDSISCNAVDGTVLSCNSCEAGYWGETCANSCQVPDGCSNARCNQTSGAQEECVTCEEGKCTDTSSAFNPELSLSIFGLVGLFALGIV